MQRPPFINPKRPKAPRCVAVMVRMQPDLRAKINTLAHVKQQSVNAMILDLLVAHVEAHSEAVQALNRLAKRIGDS